MRLTILIATAVISCNGALASSPKDGGPSAASHDVTAAAVEDVAVESNDVPVGPALVDGSAEADDGGGSASDAALDQEVEASCDAAPVSCAPGQCGQLASACGAPLDCGACAPGQTCGGSGTPNVCAVGKIVLFVRGETWEWDGNSWTSRSTMGPSSRGLSAMAALNGKAVLFGGVPDVSTFYPVADTWEWDGNAWTQRAVLGPSGRTGHAMATLNGKVLLFGGSVVNSPTTETNAGDTWEWDGTAWTQRTTPGPSPRNAHRMATLNGKIILFGGQDASRQLGDIWEWDGTVWTQRATSGPSARAMHGMATLNGKVVLYGGENGAVYGMTDTWEWDGNSWTERDHFGSFSGRIRPAMATLNGRVVLFGGYGLYDLNETWEWDGQAWTQRILMSNPPAAYPVMATR